MLLNMSDPYPIPMLDLYEGFDTTHFEIMLQDSVLQKELYQFSGVCDLGSLKPLECLSLLKVGGCLGPLYKSFLQCTKAKKHCFDVLGLLLTEMKYIDKLAKQSIINQLLTEKKTSMMDCLQEDDEEQKQPQKVWSKQVVKLSGIVHKDQSEYAIENFSTLCILDMTAKDACWFKAMAAMKVVRKLVNAHHATTHRSVWHLSILEFGDFQVFAVNQKSSNGKGTTRILWPMTKSVAIASKEEAYLRWSKIRVLDMSYGDLSSIIMNIFLPKFKNNDASLAKCMLGILDNHLDSQSLNELEQTQISLGLQRCASIKGMRLNQDTGHLEIDKIWWVSKKSVMPMDLDGLGVKVTLYESICNILAILFIAEPRHAMAMYPTTVLQLKDVVDGRLTFEDLLSSLDDEIQHGRLLPGANVLGPPLRNVESKTKFKAQETLDKIVRNINPRDNKKYDLTVKCPIKSFAMKLADSPVYVINLDEFVDYNVSIIHAIDAGKISILPLYEPSMKSLFSIFLRAISFVKPPVCAGKIKKVKRKAVSEELIKKEYDQKNDDLNDDEGDYKSLV